VYDIYEGEGAKLHITSNLLTGFLSRAEHTNKYTFGRMCVLGEEPNLQIKGCWLMRG
jgi:elongation factor 1-gamma